ncbi:hypothetical protein A2U01_0097174, partial [Trifolium medium]|nr:hypothetical protein [Trifolium medium]
MASTSDEISVPIAGKWAHFIIKNDGTKLVPNPYG